MQWQDPPSRPFFLANRDYNGRELPIESPQDRHRVMRCTCLTVAAGLLAAACGEAPETELPVQVVGDMKETMTWVLDPAADTIWGATGYVITADGEEDLTPTTEEGWAAVRHGAVVLAESGNLLLMPHLMPAGELGPAPWIEFSHGMTRIAQQAIEAVDNRDSEALFEIGGHLYNVCVACHQAYARMPTDDAFRD